MSNGDSPPCFDCGGPTYFINADRTAMQCMACGKKFHKKGAAPPEPEPYRPDAYAPPPPPSPPQEELTAYTFPGEEPPEPVMTPETEEHDIYAPPPPPPPPEPEPEVETYEPPQEVEAYEPPPPPEPEIPMEEPGVVEEEVVDVSFFEVLPGEGAKKEAEP